MSKVTNKMALAVLFVLVLAWIACIWLAPFSVQHGYYVGAAKLMAEGLTPWKDFNIMDTPLGLWIISLPYRLTGTAASGNVAVIFLILVQLLNVFLLHRLLARVQVKGLCQIVTLAFFVVIAFSTNSLMVSLEPIAMSFLLAALLCARSRKLWKHFLAALFLILAICCKAQALVAFPAFLLVSAVPERKHWRWKSLFTCGLFSLVLGALALWAITLWTQEPRFWSHISLAGYYEYSFSENLKALFTQVAIQAGRCSLYLLIPGLVLYKWASAQTRYYSWVAVLAFVTCVLVLILDKNANFVWFLYPFVLMALGHGLQQSRSYMWIFYLTAFLIPGYLGLREFQKIGMGEVKAEQQDCLEFAKEVIDTPAQVAVLVSSLDDYDLCTQVFSEIPGVRPVDLKHTTWGFVEWKIANQNETVNTVLEKADYLVLNTDFELGYVAYNLVTFGQWASAMMNFLAGHETMAIGEMDIVKR